MKAIDLMIFDLDGTLVTSGNDIAMSVNYTLETLGLPVVEYRIILQFIGDGVRKLIERSLGPASQDRFDEAIALFSAHYHDHMLDTTTLYPGVSEVLQYFQDKKKVLLTNKRYQFARDISDGLDIANFFDEIMGADSTFYMKPDARLIYPLLRRFSVRPEQTVMIGDGVNDVLLAKNAGVLSCSFLNGLTDRNVLLKLKPDFSYENLLELTKLFC
jgi:phosphoglycolate phosphatase